MKIKIKRIYKDDEVTRALGLHSIISSKAPADGILISILYMPSLYVRSEDLKDFWESDADEVEFDSWEDSVGELPEKLKPVFSDLGKAELPLISICGECGKEVDMVSTTEDDSILRCAECYDNLTKEKLNENQENEGVKT